MQQVRISYSSIRQHERRNFKTNCTLHLQQKGFFLQQRAFPENSAFYLCPFDIPAAEKVGHVEPVTGYPTEPFKQKSLRQPDSDTCRLQQIFRNHNWEPFWGSGVGSSSDNPYNPTLTPAVTWRDKLSSSHSFQMSAQTWGVTESSRAMLEERAQHFFGETAESCCKLQWGAIWCSESKMKGRSGLL